MARSRGFPFFLKIVDNLKEEDDQLKNRFPQNNKRYVFITVPQDCQEILLSQFIGIVGRNLNTKRYVFEFGKSPIQI